jgi:lactate dehydrogenase-like 2-hydroxyacid dehydrogenase
LGLLGIGLIGKEMAKIGAFFGLNLYYYDILRLSPEQEKEFNEHGLDWIEVRRDN